MAARKKEPKKVDPATDLNGPYGCLSCLHSELGRNVPLIAIKCDFGHNTKYGRQCKKYEPNHGRRK